ncbi:MAG: UPF0182 family protein, partial [Nanoarchaeota archaeon]
QQVAVDPYYIIMKLPDEDKAEFILMTPFTPIKKDNMVGWLAARMDGEHYGKLLLFQFPKDSLFFGPSQIEAKIDQDSEISQELTLWSQRGSSVIRGNLLVIPIGGSIIYIEPLYLQSEKGQLPELKRVIVSDGTRVVMEQRLDLALLRLFDYPLERETDNSIEETDDGLIASAQQHYDAVLDAMQTGDWVKFGENFEKLGNVLGKLE